MLRKKDSIITRDCCANKQDGDKLWHDVANTRLTQPRRGTPLAAGAATGPSACSLQSARGHQWQRFEAAGRAAALSPGVMLSPAAT